MNFGRSRVEIRPLIVDFKVRGRRGQNGGWRPPICVILYICVGNHPPRSHKKFQIDSLILSDLKNAPNFDTVRRGFHCPPFTLFWQWLINFNRSYLECATLRDHETNCIWKVKVYILLGTWSYLRAFACKKSASISFPKFFFERRIFWKKVI